MKKMVFWFLIIPFLFSCPTTQKLPSDFSINFIVDKNWDTVHIFNMFQSDGGFAGLANRARNMGIDYDFAKMIHDAKNYSEIKGILENFVDNRYREIGNGLKRSVNDYSAAWEPCIKEFSDVIKEVTQHDWFYNSYTCVVSAFHVGLSDWHGNKITRRYGEDPVEQRYTTAFELVLSHVFHISRKYYDTVEAPDHIIWAISELSALIILDDSRLVKLWSDNYVPFHSIGYLQLQELELKLRIAYKNSADFMDYLQAAIQLAKEMNRDFTSPYPENTASIWLVSSMPDDLRQLIPTAIGRSTIIDNSLSVDLVEPINYQDRGGWWGFSNKAWTAEKGEYYILFVPMRWLDNGGFGWELNEAQIYVGDDSIPVKFKIDSSASSIGFSLDQFNRLF
jgi:hypothetical protein